MDASTHTMSDLFAQLGLPNEEDAIQAFMARHGRLPESMALADAPFWTPQQAQFLREQLQGDADWAEVVDQLNVGLHR